VQGKEVRVRRPLPGRARGKQRNGSARTWRGSSAEAGAAAQGSPPRHAATVPPSGPAASSRLAQFQQAAAMEGPSPCLFLDAAWRYPSGVGKYPMSTRISFII